MSQGSVELTLKRLEQHGLVDHRGRYWKITDAEHAAVSAAFGAGAADVRDGGFSDEEVEVWTETAVNCIKECDDGGDA